MITVSIIEDNEKVAEGLKHAIDFHKGFSVISVNHSSEKALEEIKQRPPDIILLDIYLPGMNGVEAIHEIKKTAPGTDIIMLTSSDKDEHIFESLRAGAAGYLMKNSTASQIIDSINTVLEGGAPMSKSVSRKVINTFRTTQKNYKFTPREKQILHYLAAGKSTKEISDSLFVEKTTAKYHLTNIYKKLGVQSKAEAISKVLRENIASGFQNFLW